jgi:hypothetical protein
VRKPSPLPTHPPLSYPPPLPDPLAENNRIFSFLNLPPLAALEPVHEHARSYEEEMLAEDKEWLAGKYAAHNEKLFEFLGYRIPEWTTPAEDQK